MATAARKVIVFGPTGGVGSATARTAGALGARVTLAMRTVDKPISGLTAEVEKQQGFERVHADLTDASSVRAAAEQSGATCAFIYLALGMHDHMKSTIEALKAGGIEFVVFLSSFTVRGNLQDIPPSDIIPFVHAQVELALEQVYGKNNFVALRPGSFASNMLQYKSGLKQGQAKIFLPDGRVDCIVPEDIGRVAGTILAKGPQDQQRAIYLYGPTLLDQGEAVRSLARALGVNEPRIENVGKGQEDEAYKMLTENRGLPPPIAKYMISQLDREIKGENQVFGYSVQQEELSNVEKYSGKKGTSFEEWVTANKVLFA